MKPFLFFYLFTYFIFSGLNKDCFIYGQQKKYSVQAITQGLKRLDDDTKNGKKSYYATQQTEYYEVFSPKVAEKISGLNSKEKEISGKYDLVQYYQETGQKNIPIHTVLYYKKSVKDYFNWRKEMLSTFDRENMSEKDHKWLGKRAEDFFVVDMKGKIHSKEKYLEKVIVMNLWGTWCGPCIAEIPELNEVVDKFKDNNEIVFLSFTNDHASVLKKFLEKHLFKYHQIPESQFMFDTYQAGAPTHIIIDRDGIIQFRHTGTIPAFVLESKILEII